MIIRTFNVSSSSWTPCRAWIWCPGRQAPRIWISLGTNVFCRWMRPSKSQGAFSILFLFNNKKKKGYYLTIFEYFMREVFFPKDEIQGFLQIWRRSLKDAEFCTDHWFVSTLSYLFKIEEYLIDNFKFPRNIVLLIYEIAELCKHLEIFLLNKKSWEPKQAIVKKNLRKW